MLLSLLAGRIVHEQDHMITEMIVNIDLDNLEKRRDLAGLSMMYRIVHGLADNPVEPYLTPPLIEPRRNKTCLRGV